MTTLPTPRTPDPSAAPPLRWGILAPGWIAGAFATAVRLLTRQELYAVASRTRSRAEAFAADHGVAVVHDSYEALVADPAVDAVYVASPHSEHHAQAKLAIEAGKHVLVEKAFARNAGEARDLVAAAAASDVTLMEAMWARFLPRTDIVRQLLEQGELGDLEAVRADHGQPLTHVPRLMEPALAGGALLDLGVYPVSYALFVLGVPGTVRASGTLTDTGVDRQLAITLSGFPDHPGAMAHLQTTLAARTPTTADINGSTARIELDSDFYAPGTVRLVRPDGGSACSPPPVVHGHHGLAYEVAHFAQLVADGRRESPLLPLAGTVAVVEVMDEVRRQVGVVFPGE
jgi:predicted dehydrogenase